MANLDRATDLPPSLVRQWRRLRFRTRAQIWLVVWLALLMGLFSGVVIPLGPVSLTTIALDQEFIAEWWPFISRGVLTTLQIAAVSIVCATLLAFLSALARLSTIAPLYSLAGLYISLMRGTPLFLQVLFIYQALPRLRFGGPGASGLILDAFTSGAIALSLNYGAYMSEIFRAGLQAVGSGQTEAALALGMSRWQAMRRIVLPQAIRIITPDIGNQFIAMQKDTSLVSSIGLLELIRLAQQAGNPRQRVFEALLVAAIWYWLLTIVLTFFQARLERFMARGDRTQHHE